MGKQRHANRHELYAIELLEERRLLDATSAVAATVGNIAHQTGECGCGLCGSVIARRPPAIEADVAKVVSATTVSDESPPQAESIAITALPASHVLNSRPGATHTLFLDFGTREVLDWNVQPHVFGVSTIEDVSTEIFSIDANTSEFSVSELSVVKTVHEIVAEDFRPFNVNVTTDRNEANAARLNNRLIHISIGGDGGWFHQAFPSQDVAGVAAGYGTYQQPGVSQVAFVFAAKTRTANFTYLNIDLGSPYHGAYARTLGNNASHEAGHTLGLYHQSWSGLSSLWPHAMMHGKPSNDHSVWSAGPSDGGFTEDYEVIKTRLSLAPNEAANRPLALGGSTLSGVVDSHTNVDTFLINVSGPGTVVANLGMPTFYANLQGRMELYRVGQTQLLDYVVADRGKAVVMDTDGLQAGQYQLRVMSSSYGMVPNGQPLLYAVGGYSVGATFVAAPGPVTPSAPSLIGPGTSTDQDFTVANLTPTLSWHAVPGASYYNVYLSQQPYGQGNLVYTPPSLAGTSVTVPAGVLVAGTKYRWNVTAHAADGSASSPAAPYYFRTPVAVTGPFSLTGVTPNPVQPYSTQTVILIGSGFDASTFINIIGPTGPQFEVPSTVLSPSHLSFNYAFNTLGTWWVRAFKPGAVFSNETSFQIAQPGGVPTLNSPGHQQIDVPTTVNFLWSPAAGPQPWTYRLMAGTDPSLQPGGAGVLLDVTVSGSTDLYQWSAPASTTLYWKVGAFASNGALMSWSVLSTFTTQPPQYAPNTPGTVSPSNGASGLNPSAVTLQATPFSDPNGGPHTATHWRVRRASDGVAVLDDVHLDFLTSRTVYGLQPSTAYNWEVAYRDSTGLWSTWSPASYFTTAAPPNDAPTLGELSDSPDPLVIGGVLTLAASNVADANGNLAGVRFYQETNGVAGLQTGANGDVNVGEDTDPANGWTAALPTFSGGLAPGTYTYHAQAFDALGATSGTASTTHTLQAPPVNVAPTIGAFAATPNPAFTNSTFALTATDVTDPNGNLVGVRFYREQSGSSGLDPSSDLLVGTDTDPSGGWSITLPTGSVAYWWATTYYAQAFDAAGLTSAVATATHNTVYADPPTVTGLSASPNPIYVGSTLQLAATGITNTMSVSFYRETNDVAGYQQGDAFVDGAYVGGDGTASITLAQVNVPGTLTFYVVASNTEGSAMAATNVTVRTLPTPVVTTTTFEYASAPHRVRFAFAAGVAGGGLAASEVVVTRASTGVVVPDAFKALSYDAASNAATLTFPGYPNGVLPDGDYQVTLPTGSVLGADGLPQDMPYTGFFHVLAGDANRDRRVNFSDLAALAANYGQTNLTYAQGNFDYSPGGGVSFADLALLAARYGKVISTDIVDDFERPDAMWAGNGWTDVPNSLGSMLRIVNGKLTGHAPGGPAGVYRPAPLGEGVRIRGSMTGSSVTSMVNGRFYRRFAIRSDGTLNSGYGLTFNRASWHSSHTQVAVVDGATVVATANVLGDPNSIDFTVLADGSISGTMSGRPFSFPPHAIASQGEQFLYTTELASPNHAYWSTLDNLSVESVPALPSADLLTLMYGTDQHRAMYGIDLVPNSKRDEHPFAQGNFDHSPDGAVGFADLALVAARYGTGLPALPVPLVVTGRGTPAASVARDVLA